MSGKPNALVNPEQMATNAQSVIAAFTAKNLKVDGVTLRYEDLGTVVTGPQFSLREVTATVQGADA